MGGDLFDPDYSKSTLEVYRNEVYRNSVEAAIIDFSKYGCFLPMSGATKIHHGYRDGISPWCFGIRFVLEERSLGNRPAGRNRFGIFDKELNIISLTGFIVDHISSVEPYSEKFLR